MQAVAGEAHYISGLGLDMMRDYSRRQPKADQRQYFIKIGSETTFPSALFVIRSPSYLVWSITLLLIVGLTDLGDSGRHLGGNKAIVVFSTDRQFMLACGNYTYLFSYRAVVIVKNSTSGYFEKIILAVEYR
jgi:hypothetical protein